MAEFEIQHQRLSDKFKLTDLFVYGQRYVSPCAVSHSIEVGRLLVVALIRGEHDHSRNNGMTGDAADTSRRLLVGGLTTGLLAALGKPAFAQAPAAPGPAEAAPPLQNPAAEYPRP